jgi:hypothetical protein
VGQIGLPFSESGAIKVLGFSLPLESDSIVIASLRWTGSFRLRIEEIAASDEVAARQAASLATLVTVARGFAAPLGQNNANNGLKEVLATAEITQKRNRVIATATLSPSKFSSLTESGNSLPATQP